MDDIFKYLWIQFSINKFPLLARPLILCLLTSGEQFYTTVTMGKTQNNRGFPNSI